MKRWFALVAFLSLFLIAFVGCSGDDNGGGGTTDVDSGSASDSGGFGKDSGGKDATTTSDGGIEDSSVTDTGTVDSGFDAGFDAGVDSGPPFVVTVAASTGETTATITFSDPPNATEANTFGNYAINNGLTVSNAVLSGNTVTLTTSAQSTTSYTVTVTGVTRDADAKALSTNTANFMGMGAFDVASAAAANSTTVNVTFDAPPETTSANNAANYTIPGLTVNTAVLTGSVVKLTTTTQTATSYTVTVAGVTRASDAATLTTDHVDFTGHPAFNVSSAVAKSATSVNVVFDAPPNTTNGTLATNFTIAGLTVTGAALDPTDATNQTITLTTSAQTATSFTVNVANVTRASDDEPLTTNAADFTGRAPFDLTSATSTSSVTVDLLFSDPPLAAASTTNPANYSIAGLTVISAAFNITDVTGKTITLTTSAQTATSFTVNVAGVVRTGDSEPLTVASAIFTGTAPSAPTVTGVAVVSMAPNGTTPYNTGAVTLTITGTEFATVVCPTGVKLDDVDGLGTAVGTVATTCSVDSNTQITATFPAGIVTNGTTGWNVLLTNVTGSNATSAVKFIPQAGLLISEILIATTASADEEFIEVYNPTAAAIDTQPFDATTHPNGLGLKLHQRASGAGTDTAKTLTLVNGSTGVIPSHGFLLITSTKSITDATSWATHADYSYSAAFGANGGVYINISGTAQSKVIDKVGWGTQAAGGYEGTAITPTIDKDNSVERKPAGGAGATTDTDVNSADFNAESTTLTPKGTTDGTEP